MLSQKEEVNKLINGLFLNIGIALHIIALAVFFTSVLLSVYNSYFMLGLGLSFGVLLIVFYMEKVKLIAMINNTNEYDGLVGVYIDNVIGMSIVAFILSIIFENIIITSSFFMAIMLAITLLSMYKIYKAPYNVYSIILLTTTIAMIVLPIDITSGFSIGTTLVSCIALYAMYILKKHRIDEYPIHQKNEI